MNRQTAHSAREMQRIAGILANLPEESYPVEVSWGPPRRTNAQNAYLWGVVYKTFAEGLGDKAGQVVKPEWVHELCKQHFMPRHAVPGTDKTVPMSTTELCRSGNEGSFQEYVEQIQALAAHKGIFIPDPKEV